MQTSCLDRLGAREMRVFFMIPREARYTPISAPGVMAGRLGEVCTRHCAHDPG